MNRGGPLRLMVVRDRLERLVMLRWASGFSPIEQEEYDHLLRVEGELLGLEPVGA